MKKVLGIITAAAVLIGVVVFILVGVNNNSDNNDNTNEKSDREASNVTYTKDGVPIPLGFYYVGGTKDTGVVISDNKKDENRGDSHAVTTEMLGNQFVWIPVDSGELTRKSWGLYNWDVENGATVKIEPGTDGVITDRTYYDEENPELYESVKKHKGFYVGRYETSYNGKKAFVERQGLETIMIDGVKYHDYEYDSASFETAKKLGAKYAADHNVENSVASTMLSGAQWDTICLWLERSGYDVDNDSTSWGFYYDESKKDQYAPDTGSQEFSKANNIYDFAGNKREWTLERRGTQDEYVVRGGEYGYFEYRVYGFSTSLKKATERYVSSSSNVSFRIALYIK